MSDFQDFSAQELEELDEEALHQDELELAELEGLKNELTKLKNLGARRAFLHKWAAEGKVSTWQLGELMKYCDTTGFDLAVQHLEAQIAVWQNTPVPPEVVLDQAIKNIKALKALVLTGKFHE